MTQPDALTPPEKRTYFPALDGIRAFAFLLIFLFHYVGLPGGWAGVDIFFVLSGFLITGILYDRLESQRRFRNFYLRRAIHIFPLYYGVFVFILVLAPLPHWQWGLRWFAWPLYFGNFLRLVNTSAYYNDDRLIFGIFGAVNLPRNRIYSEIADSLVTQHQLMVTAALASVGTALLSWFSFCYFESPSLALKDKLTRYEAPTSTQLNLY